MDCARVRRQQDEKATPVTLLGTTAKTGIALAEHFAMFPVAEVSGWSFSHPQFKYFAVGRIGVGQVGDYADHTGQSKAEAERRSQPGLAYGPTE